MTSLEKKIVRIASQASLACRTAAQIPTELKNKLLLEMARELRNGSPEIWRENEKDLRVSEKKGIRGPLIDRLSLTEGRIEGMANGLEEVARLPDPVGQVARAWKRPNGLEVSKVRIPLGVIAVIYESRPNVTVDAAGLCLKSGNSVILRGGSEAIHSNLILGKVLRGVLKKNRISPDIIQVVPMTDRRAMQFLVRQTRFISVVIPRGGEQLMQWMEAHSKIPVIKHDKGVCHVFVDQEADLKMAEKIVLNAKVQRPGVCNAMEALLVHRDIAKEFLPKAGESLRRAGVEIRGDREVQRLLPGTKKASIKDWSTEYLDLKLSVRIVSNLEEAIRHIERYGSHHTEAIVTRDPTSAREFLKRLQSSVVLWNASTRFNDGGELGLGAEMGISTSKLHAFGPMGLEELTITKFIVKGAGHIRE